MFKALFRTALISTALLPLMVQAAPNGSTDEPLPIDLPPPANTVPEPASMALVGMALIASLALRRRRRDGSAALKPVRAED